MTASEFDHAGAFLRALDEMCEADEFDHLMLGSPRQVVQSVRIEISLAGSAHRLIVLRGVDATALQRLRLERQLTVLRGLFPDEWESAVFAGAGSDA